MKKKNQKNKAKSGIILPLIVAPLIIAMAVSIFIFISYEESKKVDDSEIVATVNGYKITALELSDRMAVEKNAVIDKFGKDYKEEINEDFWEMEVESDGKKTTPRAYLQQQALNELIRYKVEQKIAVENGIISEEVSYQELLAQMKQENAERSKNKAEGKPVYGVTAYNKNTYFKYYYSNLGLKNRYALSEKGKPLFVDDSELKNWYDKVKSEKYPKFDTYKIYNYVVYYSPSGDGGSPNLNLAKDLGEKIKAALKGGKDIYYIKQNISSQVESYYVDISDENASSIYKNNPELYNAIIEMDKGDVSDVLVGVRASNGKNVVYVAKCESRKDGGFKDFEENKSSIFTEYTQEKYEKYIDEEAKKAEVKKFESFEKITGLD